MAQFKFFVFLSLILAFAAILIYAEGTVRTNLSQELGLTPFCVNKIIAKCADSRSTSSIVHGFDLFEKSNGCSAEFKHLLETCQKTAKTTAQHETFLLEIKNTLKATKEFLAEKQTLFQLMREWIESVISQKEFIDEIKTSFQSIKGFQMEFKSLFNNFSAQNVACETIKSDYAKLEEKISQHENLLIKIKNSVDENRKAISELPNNFTEIPKLSHYPHNCWELLKLGDNQSGIRTVYPFACCRNQSISVFCDQTSDGGGWTVFQRRDVLPVREDFYRSWQEYQRGFGNLTGEFWLGLDAIYALVAGIQTELRIELEDFEGQKRWAKYSNFSIEGEDGKYRLHIEGYSGNAGDSMKNQNGYMFTTKDQDNDVLRGENCAKKFLGAWWYEDCHRSNLNGYQHEGKHKTLGDGINWYYFRGDYYSMKKASMKLRPNLKL